MKISAVNNIHKQNFRGTFFYSGDDHCRNREIAMGLTTIEGFSRNRPDKKLPVFYLNGGDFMATAGINSGSETEDIYGTFAATNPDIKSVFTIGNMEASFVAEDVSSFNSKIDKIRNGIKNMFFIFAPKKALQKTVKGDWQVPEYIKPYTILKDTVKTQDGSYKTQNVAVIATGSDNASAPEAQKAELEDAINQLANESEKPDKVFFISHNFPQDDLSEFAYNKLQEKGLPLDLVLMGHSHKVYEKNIPGTDIKIVSPPPNALGLLQIETTENGVSVPKIPEMPLAADGNPDPYNYYQETCLHNGRPAMFTPGGKIPLEKAASKYKIGGIDQHIKLLSNQVPKLRATNRKAPSITTELGTTMANGMRDLAKADFGTLYGLHIRTPLMPSEDNTVTLYDVRNTFQNNFNVCLIRLNAKQLVELFEKALDKQGQGSDNNAFLEYSDNVEITRDPSKKEGEWGKIKQIRIKRGDETIELFDKDGNLKSEKTEFSIATCSYMTGPQNNKIIMDDDFKVQEKTESTLLDALMFELNEISSGRKNVSCAKMLDC